MWESLSITYLPELLFLMDRAEHHLEQQPAIAPFISYMFFFPVSINFRKISWKDWWLLSYISSIIYKIRVCTGLLINDWSLDVNNSIIVSKTNYLFISLASMYYEAIASTSVIITRIRFIT